MKNRFNNITSKEWLPFQKSWFIEEGDKVHYSKNIRFFIKYDDETYKPNVFFKGSIENIKLFSEVAHENKAYLYTEKDLDKIDNLQYIFFDLRNEINANPTLENYNRVKKETIELLEILIPKLKDRRFVSILIPNIFQDFSYYPFAWDMSYSIATGLSLKDEKIACLTNNVKGIFQNDVYYELNFRKDENATLEFQNIDTGIFKNISLKNKIKRPVYFNKRWEIIKPKRRNKKEILHPAKYPENLIEMFIETFTEKDDNVFDPMTGTGSTQLAALSKERNAYGTELSNFFTGIAISRLEEYLNPKQTKLDFLGTEEKNVSFKILNKDVRDISKKDFPTIDYIITSPPYWDMLNMKGAENQAKRKQKGLKVNYSDDEKDLGNIADYNEFIDELSKIYFKLMDILKPGGAITIIVKNIKKKGRNYPFAYDLARILQKELILIPEFFWLQDDINLAPYGYGNTFVSNTFHQYCLTFVKPEIK